MAIQSTLATFRQHEGALHVRDIGVSDPKRRTFKLLGILGFRHFDMRVDFASSNQPLFLGRGIMTSVKLAFFGGKKHRFDPLRQ